MADSEDDLPSAAAVTPMKMAAITCPPTKPIAANSSHIQAAGRSFGAAPAASWAPREPVASKAGSAPPRKGRGGAGTGLPPPSDGPRARPPGGGGQPGGGGGGDDGGGRGGGRGGAGGGAVHGAAGSSGEPPAAGSDARGALEANPLGGMPAGDEGGDPFDVGSTVPGASAPCSDGSITPTRYRRAVRRRRRGTRWLWLARTKASRRRGPRPAPSVMGARHERAPCQARRCLGSARLRIPWVGGPP